jgi:2-aminoadipate transaminase
MRRTAVRELLKVAARPGMISFAGGLPAPELFPVAATREACLRVLCDHAPRCLQYGETEGVPELRDWVAARFSRSGHALQREHVMIVSGGQQALDLIGRVLLNDGDGVVVENPTYLALLSAWRPFGARFLAVGSDADGMCIAEIDQLANERLKLIYTVPNFQNPQGTTLSRARREELIEALGRHDSVLVEDNPYGELRYSGEVLPDVLALASGRGERDRVIHIGTFSKVLAPGLRVGWVVAAPEVIEKLVQAKQAADLHTATFNQYLVLELLRSGTLESQLPRLRSAYGARRDAMLASLARHFPAGVTWTRPDGGMFLLVTLPRGRDAAGLLAEALKQGVAFVPGEDFHLNGEGQNTFRLNFSNCDSARIETGIGRLGGVLHRD